MLQRYYQWDLVWVERGLRSNPTTIRALTSGHLTGSGEFLVSRNSAFALLEKATSESALDDLHGH
jgi:hypothetical protein